MRGPTLTVVAALAVLLGGCGSDAGSGQVASAGGTATSGASTPTMSADEMGVKFAQCMREHGIDMADPEPGRGAQLRVTGADQQALQKAMEACREYNPNQNASPGDRATQTEQARKFAECMRQNGVEAFPDPDPNQPGIKIDKKLSADPDFASASQKCQEVLAGGQ